MENKKYNMSVFDKKKNIKYTDKDKEFLLKILNSKEIDNIEYFKSKRKRFYKRE